MKTLSLALPILLTMALPTTLTAETASPKLTFASAGPNEFTFDTGVLKGKLRAGGRANGLSSVLHVPSGVRLDASLGLFSHYRVFSAAKRYGTAAWDWPAESKLNPDGSVETHWAAADERPFELHALYRWTAPNALDLETTVSARTNLPAFESFLASYFTSGFTNAMVYTQPPGGNPEFLPVLPSAGTWQAFPRDAAAAAIIKDGRWKLDPNPVDWVLMPPLAKPLAVRRAPGLQLTAIIMAPASDCFAVCTPNQVEPHYSTYLCLFGRDLAAGSKATARARLLIGANLSEAEILAAYRSYSR